VQLLGAARNVGWSMSAEMKAQLVTDALVMAIWRRGKPDALLHHSDRGSQYTSEQFQRLTIQTLKGEDEEIKAVAAWIAGHSKAGVMPHEFGLFVRSTNQLSRAQAAAKKAGIAFKVLDENIETTSGYLSIGTMHLAKGLEFRAVAVMACDDEIVPYRSASRRSGTTPICRRSTTPSVICSTSPAPAQEITC
jgi:Integrase core domain